jgi:outer membrane protein assembly factor BamE (lipoprotein component of BamABCDE complex)
MEEFVKVQTLSNAIEASLMDSVLTERGIPHLIVSFHDSAYDGLFQAQKGWGVVRAPKDYENEIKTIYKDISSHEYELPPDEGD